MKWWGWVLIALAALLLLGAGVTAAMWVLNEPDSTSDEQPGGDPSPTVPATPTETPEPTEPVALVMPLCEQLNPGAQQLTDEMLAKYPTGDIMHGEQPLDQLSGVLGPAAQTALSKAERTRVCTYPFHYEAGLHQFTSELIGAPREALVASIRADSDFVSSTIGPAEVFVWREPLSEGHWIEAYTTHVFLGDFWVAMYGPTDEFTDDAIDALVAANPQLAN